MSKDHEITRQRKYREIIEKKNTVFAGIKDNGKNQLEKAVENVLGPAINSFIIWVLQESRKNGIQRLYFLARDGYLMYQCARIYCDKQKLPIECRYLSCSRYSVRIPLFHMDMEEALEYVCRGGIDVTLDKILERAGLSCLEKEKVLELVSASGTRRYILPYAELPKIKNILKNCRYFMDCMYQHSVEAYPIFEKYLKQEGLLEQKRAALVDSGWVGSMQKTLNMILERLGRKENLTGYYWGLYELPRNVKRKDYFCYYFSPEKGLREKVYFSNCLFETIFSAPHGMTIGYERLRGKIFPRYGEIDEQRQDFMIRLSEYIREYTEKASQTVTDLYQIDTARYKKMVKDLLRLLMGYPTASEAELFGSLEFSDDVLDNSRQQVAVKMTEQEIQGNHVWNKALTMLGIRKGYIKESAWLEGTIARFGKRENYHWFMYRMYKYLLYMRKKYNYLKMREKE